MPQALIIAAAIPGLTTVGATGAVALTTAGTIVASGLTAAIGIGINLLRAPSVPRPKPQDVKGIVRASVTPRWRIYGRVRRGGAIVYIRTIDGDLYQVLVFCDGPVKEFEAFYIDDREVTLDSEGWAISEPYGGNSARIQSRTGTATQTAFAPLVAAEPDWTNDHRLKRIACAMLLQSAVEQEDFSNIYPNRIAALNAVIMGEDVYDPRDGLTSTSQNLALACLDWLKHADGADISANLIDQELFGIAAGICGQVLEDRYGDNVRRYYGGLAYSFDEEPKDVLQRFLTAMDGRLFLTQEGKLGLLAGAWVEPTVILDDEHVLDFDLADGAGPFRTANEVIVKYTQVEANYAAATADPWRDEASIAERGVKSISPEIYEVQEHNHARRLAKLIAHRANPRWVGTIRTTLAGAEAIDQRFIRVKIDDLLIDEDFEVGGFRLLVEGTLVVGAELDIQSFSLIAYDFNAATEEGTAPVVPDAETDEPIPAPTAVTLSDSVQKITEIDVSGTPTDIRANVLIVVVAARPSKSLRTEAEYKLDAGADWQPFDLNDAQLRGVSGAVEVGKAYKARARYVSLGRKSDWTESNVVTVTQP